MITLAENPKFTRSSICPELVVACSELQIYQWFPLLRTLSYYLFPLWRTQFFSSGSHCGETKFTNSALCSEPQITMVPIAKNHQFTNSSLCSEPQIVQWFPLWRNQIYQ